MSLTRDDLRAAVRIGAITEAQAAHILALADARTGARENLDGLDEPFELFRGFNEVFIVVGLSILYIGWSGVTGLGLLGEPGALWMAFAAAGMAGVAALARYFTLIRRMIAPSIALTVMFALSALQFSAGLAPLLSANTPLVWAISAAGTGLLLTGYWLLFRVPFAMLGIALSVFATGFALTLYGGAAFTDLQDAFLLSAEGPFAWLTVALGLVGAAVALGFDMSDPHRVTRRSQNGFWLHVVAAPAIVNTVALTLFDNGSALALGALVAFLAVMALFAVVIDRRSFLVAGVGYVVALAITVVEDQAFLAILLLGAGLVLLGATWERLRAALMTALPAFPGKDRLPPYAKGTA